MKPIIFVLILLAISVNSFAQKEVPKTWKPGMKLEASYSGGMTQYSYKIVISDSVSYMDVVNEKGAKHYDRKFTQQELNDILAFLAKAEFDKIESEHTGPTDDKGSESVLLTWDFEVIGASESSASSIVEPHRDNFNSITTYVQSLFPKDQKKKKK